MASTMVTVGGTETGTGSTGEPPDEPGSRAPLFAVAGVVAGLLLGALFTGNGREPVNGSETQTMVSEPEAAPSTMPLTTTTTEVAPSRLATMVPGMLDVLVTSAVDRNGVSVVTTWNPSGRAPTVEPLPWGNLTADASRMWLAFGGPNRWVAGQTLWIGNHAYMEPVTSSLRGGPIWHARLGGSLAWIEGAETERTLMTGRFVAGQAAIPRAVTALDEATVLVGWTDVGFLTVRVDVEEQLLELRNSIGAVETSVAISGFPLAVGPTVVAVNDPDGHPVLLDHGLAPIAAAPWGEDCHRGRWGLGLGIAVHCGLGTDQRFEYWQDPLRQSEPNFTHRGNEYTDFGFTSNGIPYVAWIESLRPSSTILFYHPANGGEYEISYPGLVQWLESMQS